MTAMHDFDVILIGGGLANGLIADRLLARRPGLRMMIIEAGDRLGGDHTWSYHATDMTAAQESWLRNYVHAAWSAQEVRFPSYRRTLSTGYRTVLSANLHNRLSQIDGLNLAVATRVIEAAPGAVILEGGQQLSAPCVIDGRGMIKPSGLSLGYQKFFGLELEMRRPHGLNQPILMDTTVEQIDGFRFMYCLPYTPTRMLIEDTYYSDEAGLDQAHLRRQVELYAVARGWEIGDVMREEHGLLPVVLDGEHATVWPEPSALARSGMRAGLFHQTTGYSLPFAVDVADRIADLDQLTTAAVATHVRGLARSRWQQQSFYRLLNRLLFLAAKGEERRNVFARFYRLPQQLIERFYAGQLKSSDKLRILVGRPPVPISAAIGALPPSAARRRTATTSGDGA